MAKKQDITKTAAFNTACQVINKAYVPGQRGSASVNSGWHITQVENNKYQHLQFVADDSKVDAALLKHRKAYALQNAK